MTDTSPIIELQNCSFQFSQPNGASLTVLEDLSFSVQRGETVALLGRSGSGKTTLLSLLGTLRTMQQGTYFFDGVPIHTSPKSALVELRAQKMGFIFQDYALSERHSVVRNVEAALLHSSKHIWRDRTQLALEQLAAVGLETKAHNLPSQLSGGQRQRVAIARALVKKPDIIFADEPTGALDPNTGDRITALLQLLTKTQQSTLVVVTHDADVASQMERTVSLAQGKLVKEGTV